MANLKERADFGKLYPLLCYRMAENRLHRIFGKNTWWKDAFCPERTFTLFAAKDADSAQGFRDARECVQILETLTNALELLRQTQKQYPLFRNMEHMRLMILKNMRIFGNYTTEENVCRVLGEAWEDVRKMVLYKKEEGAAVNGSRSGEKMDGIATRIWDDDAAVYENFDPDYMEQNLHTFNEFLQKRMELHGWDIYALGDGIYAEPKKSLIPIFQGKAKPKPKKLKMLQERLGMHWKDYAPGFLTEDVAEYKKYVQMMRAYYSGKYAEGRKLLDELEGKIDWKYGTNEQLGLYWDALFDWKEKKITEQEKNMELWKVVEYSGVKREKLAEVGASLMRPEWQALIEIAWNYEGENLDFLARVLKKQKEYLEETGKIGFFPEYYIKILCCLCHIARKWGDFEGAEQYADQGLRMMYWLDLYTEWGVLLFEKFRIVEGRKEREDGRRRF